MNAIITFLEGNIKLKKIFSVILPFTLAVALLFPAQATTTYGAEPVDLEMYFPVDIEEHWAYNELDNFVSADLLKGYEDYNGVVTVKPEKALQELNLLLC